MEKIIREALKEDIGKGDITSQLLVPHKKVEAVMMAKENGVFCGVEVARQIFSSGKIGYKFLVKDGQKIKKGQVVARLNGEARKILKVERTVLNFLQRLSGIATLTRQFVNTVKQYKAKIYDTRKTTPLLRKLEKYAVRCGGGYNHRFGLDDMILVKDNHIRLVDSWWLMVDKLKQKPKGMRVEIEAQNLKQVEQTLKINPDIIMLDNMSGDNLRKAIALIKKNMKKGKPLIEISGGMNLDNIKKYAKLQPDRISIGALTHSAKALDISIEIQ